MKKTDKGLGLYGWLLIIISGMSLYLGTASVSGLNAIIPKFAEMYGWDSLDLLSYSLPVGIIGAVSSIIFSFVVAKPNKGKSTLAASFALMIAGLIMWGFVREPWQFLVAEGVFTIGTVGSYGYGVQILLGNCFP